MSDMNINYMENDVCADCGSGDVRFMKMEHFNNTILLYFYCTDCGCVYIERYTYDTKGIIENDEDDD